MLSLRDALAALPLIAILRGVKPEEVAALGEVLTGAGFHIIEVPLNSPDPMASIGLLSARLGSDVLIGAGTVLMPEQVDTAFQAGARLVVAPNFSPAVVERAKHHGLIVIPGVMTPSDAFSALACGADALKLFPAEILPPAAVRALRSVLPQDVLVIPVGGIGSRQMADYLAAGADGFGIGSELYSAGRSVADVAERAATLACAARWAVGGRGSK